MKYCYDESKERGVIVIEKEFGQQCQNCNRMVNPEFDIEATEKAMSKIIDRIKKSFYNYQPSHDESIRYVFIFRCRAKPVASLVVSITLVVVDVVVFVLCLPLF